MALLDRIPIKVNHFPTVYRVPKVLIVYAMSTSTSSSRTVTFQTEAWRVKREHDRVTQLQQRLERLLSLVKKPNWFSREECVSELDEAIIETDEVRLYIADQHRQSEVVQPQRSLIQQAAAAKSTSPPSDEPKQSRKRVRIQSVNEEDSNDSGEKVSPVDPVFEDEDVQIANRTTVFQPKKRESDVLRYPTPPSARITYKKTRTVGKTRRPNISRNTHCGKCGDPLRPVTGGCSEDHCVLHDEEGGMIVDPKGSTAKRGY